jgi:hypothetical protein
LMRWRYAEAQVTVLLYDGFAVLDRERSPTSIRSWVANGNDWFDVKRRNVTRFRLSRASPTTAGTIRLVFAIGSTPASTTARSAASTARGASRSFCSGPRRPRWRASRRPSGASCVSPSRVRLAVSRRLRAAVCALFEQRLLPLASGVDAAFVACSWLLTFRSFTTPRSLFDCLVDRRPHRPRDRLKALAAKGSEQ